MTPPSTIKLGRVEWKTSFVFSLALFVSIVVHFFINKGNFETAPTLLNELTEIAPQNCLLITHFPSLIFYHFVRIQFLSLCNNGAYYL